MSGVQINKLKIMIVKEDKTILMSLKDMVTVESKRKHHK
jgi:hypothetical protein